MDLRLDKRVVYVTGGSRGIGKSIVLSLLEEGAYVGTCARNIDGFTELLNSLPDALRSHLSVHACDICDSEAVRAAVQHTVDAFGRLDGVVANAGFGTSGRVLNTPPEDWLSQYKIKLLGVLHLVQAAVPVLRRSDAGRVVIMNGVTANTPDPDMAAVSASRAAVKQVAKMLAADLAPDHICVNTVNIGAIDTGRQTARHKLSGSPLSYSAWAKQEAQRRGIPLGRFGQVDEVTPAVLFLLSPLASYITASSIDLSGGLNALG